jgi:hypothetical protein
VVRVEEQGIRRILSGVSDSLECASMGEVVAHTRGSLRIHYESYDFSRVRQAGMIPDS